MTQTIQFARVKHLGARRQDNGTGFYLSNLLGIFREDGIRLANLDQCINIFAFFYVNGKGMGDCLRISHTGRRTMIERASRRAGGALLA